MCHLFLVEQPIDDDQSPPTKKHNDALQEDTIDTCNDIFQAT